MRMMGSYLPGVKENSGAVGYGGGDKIAMIGVHWGFWVHPKSSRVVVESCGSRIIDRNCTRTLADAQFVYKERLWVQTLCTWRHTSMQTLTLIDCCKRLVVEIVPWQICPPRCTTPRSYVINVEWQQCKSYASCCSNSLGELASPLCCHGLRGQAKVQKGGGGDGISVMAWMHMRPATALPHRVVLQRSLCARNGRRYFLQLHCGRSGQVRFGLRCAHGDSRLWATEGLWAPEEEA